MMEDAIFLKKRAVIESVNTFGQTKKMFYTQSIFYKVHKNIVNLEIISNSVVDIKIDI